MVAHLLREQGVGGSSPPSPILLYFWFDKLKCLNYLNTQRAIGFALFDKALIYSLSIKLIIFAVISLACGLISAWFASFASTGFAKNLRISVFEKIQRFSFKNIDDFSQGGLVTRTTSDIFYIMNSYQMLIRVAIRLPIMLVLSLVSVIKISPDFAKVYYIAIPVLAILLALISILVMPMYKKAFKKVDELNNVTQENLHGIKVVKSFVREGEEKEKFKKTVNPLYRLLLRAEKLIALSNPAMRFVIYACIITISYMASRRIVIGTMQAGDLVAVFTYNMQMLYSMMLFAMIITMILMSKTCFDRINEIFDEKVDIEDVENPIMSLENGSIEFKDVDFSYYKDKNKLALSNINFSINQGEMVGVVGPTGSGKTSLVNLIARLYDVTSGAVLVSGEDVKSYDLKVLRDNVSVVLQKNNLFSGTIYSTLLWGCETARKDEILHALEIAQIKDYVLSLPNGLDTIVEQGGNNFSGGQKQRLCIARSLLKNPKILILDDSSSALDSRTDLMLRRALRSEKKDVTKIIIAQKISSVIDCDKIIVLKSGKIEDIGTHDELLKKNEFYKTLYDFQIKAQRNENNEVLNENS